MQLSALETQPSRAHSRLPLVAHAVFVPTGMVTVMLGPLLPVLATKWSLTDTQAGYLITAQFLGALVGTISSSLSLTHLGFRSSMTAGQLLMALGVASLASQSCVVGALAISCYGAGIGLTIPAGNLMVASMSTQRRSTALNLLNFSWSAGAVSCPFLLAIVQKTEGTQFFLYAIAICLVLLTAVLAPLGDIAPEPKPVGSAGSEIQSSHLQYLRTPVAIMLGALFFIYVGTENALGVWLASYAKRTSDASVITWMSMPSYFYGALLLGRALAPLTLRRLPDREQTWLGLLLAGTSILLLIFSRSIAGIATCALFAGLGLSTLYPITIAFLSASFGSKASHIGGVMFALSTLGGATVPWLVGFVSTEFQSLRTALIVPLAGCLVMLLIFSRSEWKRLPG
ncbi:MAG TPA: MFS transporter [Terriglobales bacterium]|nr:MFS transporter [Terriglobales bacterium]